MFLFGNVYNSTVKLNFKRHWMSVLWISFVYYKRDTEIIYMMKDFSTSKEWAASHDAISIVTYFSLHTFQECHHL